MALHTRWSSGDLIFYDGTQDIFTIKNSTGGILVGEDNLGIDFTFYGATTNAYLKWDETNDTLVSELSDLTFYGSSTGSGIKFDSSADLIDFDGINITYNDPTTVATTSTITLTTTASNRTQFVDSCGQALGITLPAIAGCAGVEFKFFNEGTGAVTISDTGPAVVAVLDPDQSGLLFSNGVTWGAMVLDGST